MKHLRIAINTRMVITQLILLYVLKSSWRLRESRSTHTSYSVTKVLSLGVNFRRWNIERIDCSSMQMCWYVACDIFIIVFMYAFIYHKCVEINDNNFLCFAIVIEFAFARINTCECGASWLCHSLYIVFFSSIIITLSLYYFLLLT